jgi:LysR family transcriptional regulator, glycine cleavage system transcriptional activator
MNPMKMPPLNAIRAFAAAAKHTSFTLAAAELGVTHGAISRQVKHLEEYLGVSLFERGIRRITVTPPGRELLAGVAQALERIATTAAAVTQQGLTRTLRINVRPSFAVRWLIPHLPRFLRDHPGIEPQVMTSTAEPARLSRGTYDIAIRRGREGWPSDLLVRPFLSESACPVAAPSLLESNPITTPQDLRSHILLQCATRDGDWQAWLRLADLSDIHPAGERRFEHLEFTLQAALDGLGVALGPSALIAQDIQAGRLCAVIPSPVLALDAYCYAFPDRTNSAALAFGGWLDRQAMLNT